VADLEIVDPERSYEVACDAEGLWIPPQAWKTPWRPSAKPKLWSRRFPHLLGWAAPPHRLHRPDNNNSLKAKVMYDSRHWTG
jgi:hypothetical protein